MSIVRFDYAPLPIHEAFHRSTSREKALFGAFGSGKSYALCAEAIALGLEQPGSRQLIARKTVPELRDTTETVFFDILPTELFNAGKVSRIGGHYERFTLPNGSVFLFRSIDDWKKHKSLNLCGLYYDEADEFDEETIVGMSARLRQRDPTAEAKALGAGPITRRQTCFAANPAGHNWLYDMFIKPETRRANSEWFKSTSFDNAFLPVEFLDQLLTMPEPWIKRYVLCQFDDFAGQIYEDWNWDQHIIEPPTEGWGNAAVHWMGMDPGTRNPTAGLWVVLDTTRRRMVGIAEYEEAGIAAIEHGKAWKRLEAKHRMNVSWRVSDPSIMTRDRGTNMTLHSMYRRQGFNFALGPKDHKTRIPALGQLIHTGQFVLTRECLKTFEAIRDYKWEDLTPAQRSKGADPAETPVKKNDHLVDAAQYLASRWARPMELTAPAEDLSDAQHMSREIQADIKRQIGRKRRGPAMAPGSVY